MHSAEKSDPLVQCEMCVNVVKQFQNARIVRIKSDRDEEEAIVNENQRLTDVVKKTCKTHPNRYVAKKSKTFTVVNVSENDQFIIFWEKCLRQTVNIHRNIVRFNTGWDNSSRIICMCSGKTAKTKHQQLHHHHDVYTRIQNEMRKKNN